MKCLLCKGVSKAFKNINNKEYLRCTNCLAIMLNPQHYLTVEEERERYESHNNDVYDKGYQNFVFPIVKQVLNNQNKKDNGLDFGSGTGSAVSKLLKDNKYNVKTYDPFFDNNKERLKNKYDYILSCEVIEHFHNPDIEFEKLKSMLNDRGSLYLMTNIYQDQIDFKYWHYKDDETHVFFYHEKTFKYIKNKYRFKEMEIIKDVIVYTV